MYEATVLKKNNRICRGLTIISVCIGFYVLINTSEGTGYESYFIIPLVFGICLYIKPVLNFIDFSNIGTIVLSYTMIIKYMISPLLSCIASYQSWLGLYPGENNIRKAILLTIYELIIIYLICICCDNYYSKKYNASNIEVKPMKKFLGHYMLIIIGFCSYFIKPSAFADYRFIFDQSNLEENIIIDTPGAGIYRTFYILARYSLVLLIVNYFYHKNLKKKSLKNVIFAFLPIMINCIHISNLSRISILVPMVIGLSLCSQFFTEKKEKKTIVSFCVIVGVVFLSLLSFLKFFGEGRGDVSNANSLAWWADTINMYFTGIKETAVGCKAEDLIQTTYGYNRIPLFFNDILCNVSLLSSLSNPSMGSVRLYNTVYFGFNVISQIPPNICEGMYYFSPFFSALWPGLFVFLSYHFTYKCKRKQFLDEKFVYTFPAIWCGLILMINTTMIVANSINIALFYAMILAINKLIVFNKAKNNIRNGIDYEN